MNKILLLIAFAILTAYCGGSDKTNRSSAVLPRSPTATLLISDSETSMALVASSINEGITSASIGDLAADTSASLNLAAIAQTRTCTEDSTEGSVTVEITHSGTQTRTGSFGTSTHTATGYETRTWTNSLTDTDQACGPLKKYVKIDWTSVNAVNGLHLKGETNRSNTILTTFQRLGKTFTRTFIDKETGNRTATWATPSGATNTTTVTKTVETTVTHTSTLTKADGTLINTSAKHATLPNDPFIVTTVRDSTGKILNFTKSGTMSLTKSDHFYITDMYSQVKMDLTASEPCRPVSGTIVRNIYKSPDDTTAIATKTITFSSSEATVTGDTDATTELATNLNRDCTLVEN